MPYVTVDVARKLECVAIAASAEPTIVAAERLARLGGSVADIAVGAALAATVGEILLASLGGSAFVMLLPANGAPELYDGADTTPGAGSLGSREGATCRKVHLNYGDGVDVLAGHASVAVPGALAALELAWQRRGWLPWQEVVAPAYELARSGCPTGPVTATWLRTTGPELYAFEPASRACFYRDGSPRAAGERLFIPGLADTYDAIAREGARAFYEGDLAASFVKEMLRGGGRVSREDLAQYRAVLREPIRVKSAGYELALNPPPAIGGTAAGLLLSTLERESRLHANMAERAYNHAHAQANVLWARKRIAELQGFSSDEACQMLRPEWMQHHFQAQRCPHTTHISVATANGGACAITLSNGYGSGVTIPDTGVCCNNSLGEPELNPNGYGVIAAGQRMVSNMAPTIARHRNGTKLAFGSPGASRITTALAQAWVAFAVEKRPLEEAVFAPRLHVDRTDGGWRVQCEPGIDTSLLSKDFTVQQFNEREMYFGATHFAGLFEGTQLLAVADPRRAGVSKIVGN